MEASDEDIAKTDANWQLVGTNTQETEVLLLPIFPPNKSYFHEKKWTTFTYAEPIALLLGGFLGSGAYLDGLLGAGAYLQWLSRSFTFMKIPYSCLKTGNACTDYLCTNCKLMKR